MNSEKKKTITALKKADLDFDVWMEDILCEIENDFARGYLTAQTGKEIGFGSDMLPNELRNKLLEACEHEIWNENYN